MSTSLALPSLDSSRGKKHHSFLNPLESIGVNSGRFNLALSSAARNGQEDSLNRLSAALHSLGDKYSKQLPHLPTQPYDDASYLVDFSCRVSDIQISVDKPRSAHQRVHPRDQDQRRAHQVSCDASSQTPHFRLPVLQMSRSGSSHGPPERPTVRASLHNRSSSEATVTRAEKRRSPKSSRPISIYSGLRGATTAVDHRPATSAPGSENIKTRKRSFTYNSKLSSTATRKSVGALNSTSPPQPRRFKLPASLSSLRFRSDRRQKSISAKSPTTPAPLLSPQYNVNDDAVPYEDMTGVAEVGSDMHMHALSPLHDAFEDQRFTSECREQLALKPHRPQWSSANDRTMTKTVDMSSYSGIDFGLTSSIDRAELPYPPPVSAELKVPQLMKHSHRYSEAESISSSILDYDWPQPATLREYKNARPAHKSTGKPRPDSGLGGLMNITGSESLYSAPLYPPPANSLPPLPTKKMRAPVYTPDPLSTINLSSTLVAPPCSTEANMIHSSVLQKALSKRVEDTKELQVNTRDMEMLDISGSDGEDTAPLVPSPLRLRSQKSIRSVRIESLRRKHLSQQTTDGFSLRDSADLESESADWARRGSAPCAFDTAKATTRISRLSLHRSGTSTERGTNILPFPPIPASHNRQHGGGNTTLVKSNPSRISKHRIQASRPSPPTRRISRRLEIVGGYCNTVPTYNIDQLSPLLPSPDKINKSGSQSMSSCNHSRHCSIDSQPSTSRSFISTDKSNDTEMTQHSGSEEEMLDKTNEELFISEPQRLKNRLAPPFEGCSDQLTRSTKSQTKSDLRPRLAERINDSEFVKSAEEFQFPRPPTRSLRPEPKLAKKDQLNRKQIPQNSTTDVNDKVQFELEQLEQMKRIFRELQDARRRDRAQGVRSRSYAELLDADRLSWERATQSSSFDSEVLSRRTSETIAKIQADLQNTPPKHHAFDAAAIPIQTTTQFDSSAGRHSVQQSKYDVHVVVEDIKTPSVYHSLPLSKSSPPFESSRPTQLAVKTRGTGLYETGSKQSPESTFSRSSQSYKTASSPKPRSPTSTIASFESRTSRKRYSFISIYNSSTTPQYSPTLSTSSGSRSLSSRSRSKHQGLTLAPEGRELHISATIVNENDIKDPNMDKFVNSTAKIDRAIEEFVLKTP